VGAGLKVASIVAIINIASSSSSSGGGGGGEGIFIPIPATLPRAHRDIYNFCNKIVKRDGKAVEMLRAAPAAGSECVPSLSSTDIPLMQQTLQICHVSEATFGLKPHKQSPSGSVCNRCSLLARNQKQALAETHESLNKSQINPFAN
jgi:hypothetical protein